MEGDVCGRRGVNTEVTIIMDKSLLETIILTISIVLSVGFMAMFLLTLSMQRNIQKGYVGNTHGKGGEGSNQNSLLKKVSKWYLTRGALPFWCIFGVDCLILVYCQLMAAYLVLGGQVLVPLFWDYILLALYSLPLYYVGMKLMRSYETIVRFSKMEDLARIVCAVFIGTMLVDIVKHILPDAWLPVYPIWQEQLIMLVCAVLLMWSVRILVKTFYDNAENSENKTRILVYGTSMPSIEAGLKARGDASGRNMLIGFVRADEKEPHVTVEGADLLNPDQDIAQFMQEAKGHMMIVPISAYPDFFTTHMALVKELLDRGVSVMVSK